MLIDELPVPDELKEFVKRVRKVSTLYPPQEEAVRRGLFSTEKNFVLVTQTASGKTFLAELLLVANAIRKQGIGVYLSPLKALASEKYGDLLVYKTLGVRTALTLGDYEKDDAYLGSYDIVVTTYEKMDSILRHRPSWLKNLKLVVVDEVHFVDDEERGPVLEGLVAKLRLMVPEARIVAMSATIGNPEDIAKWLDAQLVTSDWRPVPLRQGVFLNYRILFEDGDVRSVMKVYGAPILDLVFDTVVREGDQVLVFVQSRRRATELAQVTAQRLRLKETPAFQRYSTLLSDSSDVPSLNSLLASLVRKGVCFHHAGLSYEQRRLIEEAFREGAVRVIYATPTLAAGVNLPARRVVIESYRRFSGFRGYEEIKVMEYKQFAGRAGRPGYDQLGEAVLIARTSSEADDIRARYILGKPERVESRLASPRALRSHILALIATMGPVDNEKASSFIGYTLYGRTTPVRIGFKSLLTKALRFLEERGFIERTKEGYVATRLGKVTSDVYLDPYSLCVFAEVIRRSRRLSDLTLLYAISMTPDMPPLLTRRREEEELEGLLAARDDELPEAVDLLESRSWEEYFGRLKTTLFLYDWIHEVPEEKILERYDLGPGDIRSLTETAEWIAHGLSRLSRLIEGVRERVEERLETLEVRIRHGVKEDVVELLAIPGVGRVRARRLYAAGYKTLEDVARATPTELKRIEGIGEVLAARIVEEARRLLGLLGTT